VLLDITTVLIMEIAAAIAVGTMLGFSRSISNADGLPETTWAAWLLAISFSLQATRHLIDPGWAIVVGNGAAWVAMTLQLVGYRRFSGRHQHAWWWLLLPASGIVIMWSLWANGAGYVTRTLYLSSFVLLMCILCCHELHRDGAMRRERARFIPWVLTVFTGLCMALRITVLLLDPGVNEDFYAPSLERTLAFAPTLYYTLGTGFGFILMLRERSDARLREVALSDPLTRVANRRALEDMVRRDMHQSLRTGQPLSLIVIDIDHFKAVNDTWGHAVGDQVICHVAEVIRETIRASDILARYGGEEFCVLLRDTDTESARVLATKLCNALRTRPLEHAGGSIIVTASMGVSGLVQGTGDSWETLFKRADGALYRAKQEGRDRVIES
jgi:diguanylate cyclase (GGDEF)-like protein